MPRGVTAMSNEMQKARWFHAKGELSPNEDSFSGTSLCFEEATLLRLL
jgi:hypothetical protein